MRACRLTFENDPPFEHARYAGRNTQCSRKVLFDENDRRIALCDDRLQ